MKISIEMDLSDADVRYLLENSIERVLNNAIYVGKESEESDEAFLAERASTLWQDASDAKPLVCNIWSRMQEAVRNGK